ncbi:MAG TPA: hypothetical protein VGM05_05560 [Planctomycetaceae bacterium]
MRFIPIGKGGRPTNTAQIAPSIRKLETIMSRKPSIVHIVVVAAFVGGALSTATRAGDPDAKALQMLVNLLADSGKGLDTPEAVAASRLLAKSGTKAFAVLIENMDDQRPACGCFQRDTSDVTTVGEACRNILQSQVENYTNLGKAFPQYLDGKNLKQWWRENNEKELLQLQIEAVDWTIAKIGTNDSHKSLRQSLPQLRKTLKELQAEQSLRKRIGSS